jgi:hypothetical protein
MYAVLKRSLAVLLCGLFLAACSGEKPDVRVIGFLDALQKGDLKAAEEFVDAPIFAGAEGDEALFLLYFKTLTYDKPVIESMQNDSAVVGVTVTAVDLDIIYKNLINTINRRAIEDNKKVSEYSEEELNNMLLEPLKDPASPKKTLKLTLDLTRHKAQGNKWFLSANEQLRSGIFMRSTGHIYESVDDFHDEGAALSRDISAEGTLVGIDVKAELCKFTVNSKSLSIRCAPEYADFLKERVGRTFPIVYRINTKPGESEETYWLIGFE